MWRVTRADIAESLFMAYLKRYLLGRGHVDDPYFIDTGLLSQDDILREKNNTTLRAELFLHAATGTNIPPPATEWKIRVRILFSFCHVVSDTVYY